MRNYVVYVCCMFVVYVCFSVIMLVKAHVMKMPCLCRLYCVLLNLAQRTAELKESNSEDCWTWGSKVCAEGTRAPNWWVSFGVFFGRSTHWARSALNPLLVSFATNMIYHVNKRTPRITAQENGNIQRFVLQKKQSRWTRYCRTKVPSGGKVPEQCPRKQVSAS